MQGPTNDIVVLAPLILVILICLLAHLLIGIISGSQ